MWMSASEGLSYSDLIKTVLLNGYGADFISLDMDPEIKMTRFGNFISKVKDTELRQIFSEIGRPLFYDRQSCWQMNLGPDTSMFIKFLAEIKLDMDPVYYYYHVSLGEAKFKEGLRRIIDIENVKNRLTLAFPHQQKKIKLLRRMPLNGDFVGIGWLSRDYSLILYDAGIRYVERGTPKTRKPVFDVLILLFSFNNEGETSTAQYIYDNYAQDIRNALQLEVDFHRDGLPPTLDQAKKKAIEADSFRINLYRPPEQRIRLARLLFMLKRTQEAQHELKKALAEKPELKDIGVLTEKILSELGLVEKANHGLETHFTDRSSRQNSKQTEDTPTILVEMPMANGVYPANSALRFIFTVRDYIEEEPKISAVMTDWLGNSTSISSGSPLPSRSGLYSLLISATDHLGRVTALPISFVIYDPNVGKAHGSALVKFPKETRYVAPEGANFGFLVKYDKGFISPNSYFDFSPFNLSYPGSIKQEFKSTKIDWLVISENKATFQGTGTINKQGRHNFRVRIECGNHVGNQQSILEMTIWNTPSIEIDPTHYRGILTKGKIEITKN
jgi:hypothetical protein